MVLGDATHSAPLASRRASCYPLSALPTYKTTPFLKTRPSPVKHTTEEDEEEENARRRFLHKVGQELDYQWLGPMDPDAFLSTFLPNGEFHDFPTTTLRNFVEFNSENFKNDNDFSRQLVSQEPHS
jgi:hypothetical protein